MTLPECGGCGKPWTASGKGMRYTLNGPWGPVHFCDEACIGTWLRKDPQQQTTEAASEYAVTYREG